VGGVVQLDPTYGYESVLAADSGAITLGAHAVIDVSGGSAGGLSGGTVNFRAPLLEDDGVNITIAPTAQIRGSRSTTLEAYAVWSTDDPLTNGVNEHFDGIVDPAGWYDSSGNLESGTFTTQSGTTITYTAANGSTPASISSDPGATGTQLAQDLQNALANDYFTPGTNVDVAHETFYGYASDGTTPGTLMGFVENFPIASSVAAQFANVAHFQIAPGIELDNPDANINGGNISILTNWNLGAGASVDAPAFRFNGVAPVITFRAENNVEVDASLTDGFFQIANPVTKAVSNQLYAPILSCPTSDPSCSYYDLVLNNYNNLAEGQFAGEFVGGIQEGTLAYYGKASPNSAYVGFDVGPTAPADLKTTAQDTQANINEYYELYTAYADFLLAPSAVNPTGEINVLEIAGQTNAARNGGGGFMASGTAPTPPSASDQATNPILYLEYLSLYGTYLAATNGSGVVPLPAAPVAEAVAVITPGMALPAGSTEISGGGTLVNYSSAAPLDNSPSPVSTAVNPLPLESASLSPNTGSASSSTFRLVAGANLNSSNPLAVQAAALFSGSGQDSVTMGGQFDYVDSNGRTILAPTMIRTGTGSIEIAAGNDVSLFDPSQPDDPTAIVVPGVIYTAGTPAAGAPAEGDSVSILAGGSATPDVLVTPAVNPDGAGNVSIYAQNDIDGLENVLDTTGAVTGTAGLNISQFWTQWMQTGNVTGAVTPSETQQTVQTSINFGAFDQGIMSVGGNVTISAGGNISDLAVSLPTTWYLTNPTSSTPTVNTVGAGNLTVTAGGNLYSGDYFVANGTANITAGAQIGSDLSVPSSFLGAPPVPVAPIFAAQNAVFNVAAQQGVNIGAMVDPSYLEGGDGQGYSTTSALNVQSTTGDVQFGTLDVTQLGSLRLAMSSSGSGVLPATVDMTAFTGGISIDSEGWLFPSPTGELSLLADQSINFNDSESRNRQGLSSEPVFGMLDVDPLEMPSPVNPDVTVAIPVSVESDAHAPTPLHADDTNPVRIYSVDGSIVDGVLEPAGQQDAGFYDELLAVSVDKAALIEAGQNILNLVFQGQNLRDDDVTRILAAGNIADTPLPTNEDQIAPGLVLGGPGTFDVEAGGNIGPLTNEQQLAEANVGGLPDAPTVLGIEAVGNSQNPNLPHESANIQVLFGISPGVDYSDFISAYVDPANSVPGVPSSTPALITFMEQYDAGEGVDTGLQQDETKAVNAVGTLTAAQAWTQFQALPADVQQIFAQQVLFNVMTDVGNDFNNPQSPSAGQYARGYAAINTLFPASYGYTANNLDGGTNGANQLVDTGNLDIRSTTIQTQQGGNVSILGPGGEALVGSTSAPPEIVNTAGTVVGGPGTMGILTLEQGNIDIFTDQSLLLAQSRVFTEQGGDMTIWSSNGDINAGKGAKSTADVPEPIYVCDVNH
jgi:hypothetical protein